MAIKIVHGEARTYGELGRLVGESQREERDIERIERRTSEIRQMKFQTEMSEQKAALAEQNVMRQQAWRWETMNRAQEHDLEMLFQRNQIIQMNNLQKEIKSENERDRKLKAIDDADTLSPDEKSRAKVQILTGVRLPTKKQSLMDMYPELFRDIEETPEEVVEPRTFVSGAPTTIPEASTRISDIYRAQYGIPKAEPAPSRPTPEISEPKTKEEYDRIPKGQAYRTPTGEIRFKG